MKRRSVWIRVARPPFAAAGLVMRTIYADLFGWWLDRRRSRKLETALVKEIRHKLGFLFLEKNARIIPNDDFKIASTFQLSVVTVATDDVHIRFVNRRGQFEVEVASSRSPHRWEELSNALENAELSEGACLKRVVRTRPSRSYSFYMDVERLLRSHWALLKRYCHNSC
jgi:hypothetical protein